MADSARSCLPSIVDALSAVGPQDVDQVASILSCKRKASSPSIHEVCLQLTSIDDVLTNKELLFQQQHHTNLVLNKLILCPSVYDIPWRAAVAAIRQHAVSAAESELDLDVHAFLQNAALVWQEKQKTMNKKKKQSFSPSKRLRQGESTTGMTPAKWLLAMTEAILERTNEGHYDKQQQETNPERLKDLLSILSSIIILASEFDSHLLREVLDRTFIRKVIRPEYSHWVLLHLAAQIQEQLSPSDWRGLQASLCNEATGVSLAKLSSEELADVASCIIHTGAYCSGSLKATSKMCKRWADVFVMVLRASDGNVLVDDCIVSTFATLEAVNFKLWLNELLAKGANDRHSASVVRALILLAQTIEGRRDTGGWDVNAFWGKVLAVASWECTSIDLQGVSYKSNGIFDGSPSMARLGTIVCESMRIPEGLFKEEHGRFWLQSVVDALIVKKQLAMTPAIAVITAVFHECVTLRKEVIDHFIKHGAGNVDVANVIACTVAILASTVSGILASENNLVDLLSLPTSLEQFQIMCSALLKIDTLQSQIRDFAQERLSTIYLRNEGVDEDMTDMSTQARRGLVILMTSFEINGCEISRDLLAGVIVGDNPPIPLEVRRWLYASLCGNRERSGLKISRKSDHYFRMCLLRVLSYVDTAGKQFRYYLAFRKSKDSWTQNEDFSGLFRLLCRLFRSIDPKGFKILQETVIHDLCGNENRAMFAGKGVTKNILSEISLVSLQLVICESLEARPVVDVRRYIKRLLDDEFGDSRPLSVDYCLRAHLSSIKDSLDDVEVVKESVKFHSSMEILLGKVSENCGIQNASIDPEHSERLLLAVTRCILTYLQEFGQCLKHSETISLLESSTEGFCKLLISTYNTVFLDKKRAAEAALILSATTMFCEVSTCPTVQSRPWLNAAESHVQLPLIWGAYRLIAEEKKARQLIAHLRKHCNGDWSPFWEKEEGINDKIRRLRCGILRLFRTRLVFLVKDISDNFDASRHNEMMVCITGSTKRLCKNLVSAHEGQSGGLSYELYGNFVDCIDMGLQILGVATRQGFRASTGDISAFCGSQIGKVLAHFPLQRPGFLKKTIIVWLWHAPMLLRSVCLLEFRSTKRGAAIIAPSCLESVDISDCFAELHTIAENMARSNSGNPQCSALGVACCTKSHHSTKRGIPILNLSNKKMWEVAYSAVAQVLRNHWNESIKRIGEGNDEAFASSTGLEAFCRARSNQLRVCLDGLEKSISNAESELIVLDLPYGVKTDISFAADAFLNCFQQSLGLLSAETDELIDSERFAEAAACMISWLRPTPNDLLSSISLWQTADTTATAPPTNDLLQRRLKKMDRKVWDITKILKRIVSTNDTMPLLDRVGELFEDNDAIAFREHQTAFDDVICKKYKLLEKAMRPSTSIKTGKKRKRFQHDEASGKRVSSIVGKWLDIERDEGHKISKSDEFDDLDDFLIEG